MSLYVSDSVTVLDSGSGLIPCSFLECGLPGPTYRIWTVRKYVRKCLQTMQGHGQLSRKPYFAIDVREIRWTIRIGFGDERYNRTLLH